MFKQYYCSKAFHCTKVSNSKVQQSAGTVIAIILKECIKTECVKTFIAQIGPLKIRLLRWDPVTILLSPLISRSYFTVNLTILYFCIPMTIDYLNVSWIDLIAPLIQTPSGTVHKAASHDVP